MYITMCPDLGCRVYQMNGEFNPRDATWEPRNTLGYMDEIVRHGKTKMVAASGFKSSRA